MNVENFGIYVSIPFCRSKCIYCNFDSGIYSDSIREAYIEALLEEIQNARKHSIQRDCLVDSVYFGGGTPSLIREKDLDLIVRAIESSFVLANELEITIEANPGTVDYNKAKTWASIGINRVSLGVQSFIDKELKLLKRGYAIDDVSCSIQALRAARLDNINLDLIAGLPFQTLDAWLYSLKKAFSIRPKHISVYMLEIHEGTMLFELIRKNYLNIPGERLSIDMYNALIQMAKAEGYEQYEISNFSLPGFYSHHNLKYWSDTAYLGFGCSAHSYDYKERRSNVKTPLKYIDAIQSRGEAVDERVFVTPQLRKQEAAFLGLRKIQGLNLKVFKANYNVDILKEYAYDLKPLLEAGLIECHYGYLRLTKKGLLLSDTVFLVFV